MENADQKRIDLDLDAFEPEARNVKLCGRIVEVRPPKIALLTKLIKHANSYDTIDKQNPESVTSYIDDFRGLLVGIIPAINDPDMDLSVTQLMALVEFVMKSAAPPEQKILEENGISPTADKKGGQDFSDSQPIS